MKKINYLLFVLVVFLQFSCQDEEELVLYETDLVSNKTGLVSNKTRTQNKSSKKIKLGKKLKNPYSVKNMKKAYEGIKSKKLSGKIINNLNISTTHYYIKFIPKDIIELDMIDNDSTIVTYEYPLDYEILEMGDYYHDPEVPASQPTYQYASIPFGQQIPDGVEYTVLADLFIPDDENIPEDVKYLLVEEALKITDNLEQESSKPSL
jgi:hypothetical protein